jgi:tRNA-modifying protein YgfZ
MAEPAPRTALHGDAALVPVGAHQVLRARGADRVAFLHRLVTGRIEGVAVGEGSPALLLTVKGHIVAQMGVCVLADELRLLVPPGQGAATAAALSRYAIMDDFTVEPLDGDALRPLALHGPRAEERLRAAGVPVPEGLLARPRLAHAEVAGPGGPLWLVRQQTAGTAGLWCFGQSGQAGQAGDVQPLAELERRLTGAGVPTLSELEAEVLRLEAGEPRFGVEITDEYFPMEVGLRRSIDYQKGCYLGQEPIVRIRDRGHLNWRLCTLRALDEDTGGHAVAGARLASDEKPKVGRLTSVARLPGAPAVALGMVHISVPVGAVVRLRGEAGDEGAGGAAAAPGMRWLVTGEPEEA